MRNPIPTPNFQCGARLTAVAAAHYGDGNGSLASNGIYTLGQKKN